MCSIAGAVLRTTHLPDGMIANILKKSARRGRDSWGVVNITKEGLHEEKGIGEIGDLIGRFGSFPEKFQRFKSTIIANLRAEPTTEFVKEKTISDVQPFQVGKWIVAHNGTIANDKELEARFTVDPNIDLPLKTTPIDSYIVPRLLYALDIKYGQKELDAFISKHIVGSYSFAIGHLDHPGHLYLATNYKPIYIGNNGADSIVFSSYREALVQWGIHDILPCMQYSSTWISPQRIHTNVHRPKVPERALIVCSGGLDSVVCATWAVKQRKVEKATLLHFRYGCRAEENEVRAVEDVAKALGIDTMHIEMSQLFKIIGGSPLTNTKDVIAGGEEGAEFAHEWVPARNLIMLSLATGLAEAHGYNVVFIGTNLEESGAYPDNEPEFIRRFGAIMPYATGADRHVGIGAPVCHLMKHEIVKMGLELEAPLDKTWSCYEHGDAHCGDCGPCFMRKVAFEINGAEDPVRYLKPVKDSV